MTVRGVRLIATDLDWTRGKGPEARGTAEAVLMMMAGRCARTGTAGAVQGVVVAVLCAHGVHGEWAWMRCSPEWRQPLWRRW
jgi:hypothetical protein